MPTYLSPFEYLSAFGLIFAAGVLTSVGLRQYADKTRREAAAHACPRFYPRPHEPYDPDDMYLHEHDDNEPFEQGFVPPHPRPNHT